MRSISNSDAVGFCGVGFIFRDHTTKIFVVSTKIFVDSPGKDELAASGLRMTLQDVQEVETFGL